MNLTVIISMKLLIENLLSLFNISNIFPDAGFDEPILKPAVRTFNFAFGLRRQGISDFHITVKQDLLPLRTGFVGEFMMVKP